MKAPFPNLGLGRATPEENLFSSGLFSEPRRAVDAWDPTGL